MKKKLILFFIALFILTAYSFAVQTNVIDNFESKNLGVASPDPYDPTNLSANFFGGFWNCNDDHAADFSSSSAKHSRSIILSVVSNAEEGYKCLFTSYTLGVSDSANDKWAYWELDTSFSSNEDVLYDLTESKIAFWIKGSSNISLKLTLVPRADLQPKYSDGGYYAVSLDVETNWKYFSLDINDSIFSQPDWANAVPFTTAVTEVVGISFSEDAPETGDQCVHSFWLDDVKLLVPKFLSKILYPVNGATIDSSSADIKLQWTNENSDINLYEIDLSSDNHFFSHIAGYPKRLTDTSLVILSLQDGSYFWRVRASTNNGLDFGDWVSGNFNALDFSKTYIIDDFEKYTGSLSGWASESAGLPDSWMGLSLETNSCLNSSQYMRIGFYCANDSTGWMDSTYSINMPSAVYGYRYLTFWVKPSKIGMQYSIGYNITNRAYHYNDGDPDTGEDASGNPGGTNDFSYQYLYTYTATNTNWNYVAVPHSKLAIQQWFIEAGYPNPPIDYSKISSLYITSGYVDAPHTNWLKIDNIELKAGREPDVSLSDYGNIVSGIFPFTVTASYPAGIQKAIISISNSETHAVCTANMNEISIGKFVYEFNAENLISGRLIVTVQIYDNDGGVTTLSKIYKLEHIPEEDIISIHNNCLNFKENADAKATILLQPSENIDYVSPGLASLSIYDISGRLKFQKNITIPVSGLFSYQWNGNDGYGLPLGSGLYIVKVQVGTIKKISRILIIR